MSHQNDHATDHPNENAAFWRSAEFDGLELLRATYFTHSFGRHIHEGFAVGVIERGAEKFFYRGEHFTAGSGTVVLVNPGEIHTGHAAGPAGWTYRMLYPSVALLETIATEITGQRQGMPFFPSPVVYDPQASARLRTLHRLLELPATHLERQCALYAAFGLLLTRYTIYNAQPKVLPADNRLIQQAVEYLRAHITENISLDTLAQWLGYSPFHFLRLFKQQTGLPPHAYQNHLRIQQAKTLLAQAVPPVQIATLLGFVDQSHFNRRFKQVVGVAPGQYHVQSH
ncbi:MAG: AraC family transcriptional regulator [Chloroflexi bacterium]|nr:AraC family transcriptional regulator [Chloroflexota bacterium]